MASYRIDPYEGINPLATHEINVGWEAPEAHPPVLPPTIKIDMEDAGTWRIVETRYWPNWSGPGKPCVSYLVRRD